MIDVKAWKEKWAIMLLGEVPLIQSYFPLFIDNTWESTVNKSPFYFVYTYSNRHFHLAYKRQSFDMKPFF